MENSFSLSAHRSVELWMKVLRLLSWRGGHFSKAKLAEHSLSATYILAKIRNSDNIRIHLLSRCGYQEPRCLFSSLVFHTFIQFWGHSHDLMAKFLLLCKISSVSFCYLQERKKKNHDNTNHINKISRQVTSLYGSPTASFRKPHPLMPSENGKIFAKLRNSSGWGIRRHGGDWIVYGYFILQLRIN